MAIEPRRDPHREEEIRRATPQDTISLTARAASVAGLVTAALGFPTVWRTLQKNFPGGMDNIFVQKGRTVDPTSIVYSISKDLYDRTSTPEGVARAYEERASIFERRTKELDASQERLRQFYRDSTGNIAEEELRRREADAISNKEFEVERAVRKSEEKLMSARAQKKGGTNRQVIDSIRQRMLAEYHAQKQGIVGNQFRTYGGTGAIATKLSDRLSSYLSELSTQRVLTDVT